jgi:hypothetical protein
MNKEIKRDADELAKSPSKIYDRGDGKMWSSIAEKPMTWGEAMEYAKNLREGNYDDWRLPTIDELKGLWERQRKSGPCWVSTESGPQVYSVLFYSDGVHNTNRAHCYVQCVRG